MKIGIIGVGVVGSAIKTVFEERKYKVLANDIKYPELNSKKEIARECDFIFLCLPTPTIEGKCDTSILENVIKKLDDYKPSGILIIKSTIIPGTTNKLIKKYPSLKIVYSPEFLTEKNAVNDFKNPDRIVLSGRRDYIDKVISLLKDVGIIKDKTKVLTYDDPTVAEMGKYASNSFLATKVSYANQIRIICDKYGIDPSDVMRIVVSDHRIGKTHLDPMRGPYGGMCLEKDIKAIITEAKNLGMYIPILEAVDTINKVIKHDSKDKR